MGPRGCAFELPAWGRANHVRTTFELCPQEDLETILAPQTVCAGATKQQPAQHWKHSLACLSDPGPLHKNSKKHHYAFRDELEERLSQLTGDANLKDAALGVDFA